MYLDFVPLLMSPGLWFCSDAGLVALMQAITDMDGRVNDEIGGTEGAIEGLILVFLDFNSMNFLRIIFPTICITSSSQSARFDRSGQLSRGGFGCVPCCSGMYGR